MVLTGGDGAIVAPGVFISYSHDSREHVDRVLALCDRLRSEGIEAELDQYEPVPLEGWPLWTARKVEEADFVLFVCTETFLRRFEGREEAGKGLGVTWEAAAAVRALYKAGARNAKFLPILFDPADVVHIPPLLAGTTDFLVSDEEGYEQLYRYLTDQPEAPKPKLGILRPLPARPRATTFSPTAIQSVHRSLREKVTWTAVGLLCALLTAWVLSSVWKPIDPKKSEAPAVAQRSILRGEILEAQTGEPLAGVTVQLPEYRIEQTTGKDGQYSFEVPVVGAPSIKLRAMKPGYRLLDLDLPPGDHLNAHRMWRSP